MHIIIAEDDPSTRAILTKTLEESGHNVIAAEDGEKALELAQKCDARIILADWMMPNIDGLTLCEKIRSSPIGDYVYLIIMTAKDNKDDLIKAFRSGVDDYITKPFEVEELLARIKSAARVIELTEDLNFEISRHREAEEKLSAILENSIDIIFTLDLEGNFTSINTAVEVLTGFTKTELINSNFRNFITVDTYEEVTLLLQGVIKSGKPEKNHTIRVNTKAGIEKYFEANIGLIKKDGEITGLQGSARDITIRVEAQKALKESENRNRMLVQTMKDGLGVQDEYGLITFVNDSFCKILGYSRGELLGQPVAMLHDEKNKDKFQHKINGRRKGVSESYEIEYRTKNGQIIPTIVSAQPIFDSDGQFKGSIAVITDVSEIKRSEDERRAIEAQLLQSEKMASIGQLAAGVAHEINNPTGFVNSNLSTLSDYIRDLKELISEYRKLVNELDEVKDNEGVSQYSELIARIKTLEEEADIEFILNDISSLIEESGEGTARIKKIVQDLKDFAHPGEDKPKHIDINKCLDSTLNLVWNELKYKAKIEKEFGDLPEVQCYPQQLNQVFANLLVNAAQAIETEGIIRIETNRVNGNIEVAISDTGSGIPEKNIKKIYDPFFTTKEVGKGTGLGLNVVYNIIKKHGGTIDVESSVGAGTNFKIKLPVEGVEPDISSD